MVKFQLLGEALVYVGNNLQMQLVLYTRSFVRCDFVIYVY